MTPIDIDALEALERTVKRLAGYSGTCEGCGVYRCSSSDKDYVCHHAYGAPSNVVKMAPDYVDEINPDYAVAARNALPALLRELKAAREVVEAAREWDDAKRLAADNPRAMLSSGMRTDEAAAIMDALFAAEDKLSALVDAAREGGKGR